MPTFQHSELLPEHEILQYKIPMATEEANQCSDPEEKKAEHGTELYQINDWKYCCRLLILPSVIILARDRSWWERFVTTRLGLLKLAEGVTNSAWLGRGFVRRSGSRILRAAERKRRA